MKYCGFVPQFDTNWHVIIATVTFLSILYVYINLYCWIIYYITEMALSRHRTHGVVTCSSKAVMFKLVWQCVFAYSQVHMTHIRTWKAFFAALESRLMRCPLIVTSEWSLAEFLFSQDCLICSIKLVFGTLKWFVDQKLSHYLI